MKMKLGIHTAVIFLAAAVGIAADDFSRYQVIIDRKPFGEVRVEQAQVQATTEAEKQADQVLKSLKMVAIKIEDGNTWVGLVNASAGNKGYYLGVGEKTVDGIELVEANFAEESAVVKKEGQTARLCMGSKEKPVKAAVQTRDTALGPNQRKTSSSEAARRRAEENAVRHLRVEPPNMTPEEAQLHIKNYQMEVIRQGLPPLPVPLTQEMDDQLVAEGVLPAVQPQAQSTQ